MNNIVNYTQSEDGTFIVSQTFFPEIILDNIGDEYITKAQNISVDDITSFNDSVVGVSNTRTIARYIKLTMMNRNKCTDWIEIGTNISDAVSGFISPAYKYDIEIKWVRTGNNLNGILEIENWEIAGTWDRNELNTPYVKLTSDNITIPVIIHPTDIYKVFRLDDAEVIVRGNTPTKDISIKYRVSQNNWISSTQWEPLTTENISSAMTQYDISPIRFFWIEYMVTRIGTDLQGTVNLHDINLVGDIQNVSTDYTKTNLMGLRECCSCLNATYVSPSNEYVGNGIPGFNEPTATDKMLTSNNTNGMGDNCDFPDNLANPVESGALCIGNMWDPYNSGKEVKLFESLSETTTAIFGWDIVYFLTDPDKNGIDKTFHEYQLYNIVAENKIKITVNENQFPDNQISFNQFDLSLFDSFEIQVTKKIFKRAFGVDQRPSKEDFLWFCDLNRAYQVEHAQPYRDFMNSAVYYKVILKKYNKKSSVQAGDTTIANRIEALTKNTTLDELFGIDMENDQTNVANKPQQSTLTKDLTRYEFSANVRRELITNSTLIIGKYHYDLSNVSPYSDAVKYSIPDNYVKKSDNRAYSAWFKIPEYVVNETYNLFDNYVGDTQVGFRLDIYCDKLIVKWNKNTYEMDIEINDNIWYIVEVNMHQRNNKIEMYHYKRNIENEASANRAKSSKLKLLATETQDMLADEFEILDDQYITIHGSSMLLTNIRLYNDVVPFDTHTQILNQNIIKDTQYLIIGDNSNKKVTLPNYPYN